MTSAPRVRAGAVWCRYTISVVAVWLCPARSAIASTGTPWADAPTRRYAAVPVAPRGAQSGGLGDLAELPPDVVIVEWCTDGGGEYQVVVLPELPGGEPVSRLPRPLLVHRLCALARATRPSRSARRIARASTLCEIWTVRVDTRDPYAVSAAWTSPAVSSRSLTVPSCSLSVGVMVPRYRTTVHADTSSRSWASQSPSASFTV